MPLVRGNAEELPFAAASFDLVFCDHGATTFTDPAHHGARGRSRAAARRGASCSTSSTPIIWMTWPLVDGPPGRELLRPYFGLGRTVWDEEDGSVDYQLTYGDWIRLFRSNGLFVEDLIELRPAPENAATTFEGYAEPGVGARLPRRAHLEGAEGKLVRQAVAARGRRRSCSSPPPSLRRRSQVQRAGPAPQHPAGAHRRPDPGHAAGRPAGDAVAPVADPGPRRDTGCGSPTPWHPRRCAARRASTILTGPLRHAHAGARQHPGAEPRRHEHAAGVVARRRLPHRARRQVPQRLPVGAGAVHPAGVGSLVREAEPERVDVLLRLRRGRSRGLAPLRRDAARTTPPTCSAAQALRFVQDAPADQPWFLYFSPNAPHLPWIPAPRYADAFADVAAADPAARGAERRRRQARLRAGLPAKTEADRQGYVEADRNERAMLRSVDDAFRALVDEIAARGELDNTVIVFLTDNGYVLGLHRLDGKRFPYADSIGLPFAIRTPWAPARHRSTTSSRTWTWPARSRRSPACSRACRRTASACCPALQGAPLPPRPGVFLDWGGDVNVPAWQGVRSRDFLYVRNADGFEELYRTTDRVPARQPRRRTRRAARLLRHARAVFDALSAGARGRLAARCRTGRPIIRPSSLRRPTRSQLARRRAGVVVVVVLRAGRHLAVLAGRRLRRDRRRGVRPRRRPRPTAPVRAPSAIVPGRQPDQARDLPREGEPLLRQLLRLVSRCRRRDRRDRRCKCDKGFAPGPTVPLTPAPYIYPHDLGPRVRSRSDRDQRRQDGRLQLRHLRRRPHRLHAVRSQDAARLLGARRPVRAGRPLLHVDVRADVPRAPLHGRGAVLRHRRQQDRRPTPRATTATTRPSTHAGSRSRTSRPRTPRRSWTSRTTSSTTRRTCTRSPATGSTRARASTSRSCPTSCRRRRSAGSTTRTRTSG